MAFFSFFFSLNWELDAIRAKGEGRLDSLALKMASVMTPSFAFA